MAHSPLLFVLAGAFTAYVLYTRITLYFARRQFKKDNGCQPCPNVFHKDPFLGLDVIRVMGINSKKRVLLEENRKRFERLGNTFHTRMATTPVIATCEPENIKTVLSLKFKDYSFGHRTTALTPLLGHGIFNADGEQWANSRHLLRPNFARDQVADLDAFERHFQLMLKHIPTDGSTFDLQELFFMLTIDTATEFLFNHSTNTLRLSGDKSDDNEDVAFGKMFNFAQDDVAVRLRLGPLDRFRKNTKGEDAIRVCHEYIARFVDDAISFAQSPAAQKTPERYVFIHELAKQTTDRNRIRDELINILLAGRDTTASLLSNLFFELAKQPAIYAKLRDEVAFLGGAPPSYEQLKGMKYLKWCLNECTSCLTPPTLPPHPNLALP
ncbi:cytochrome P450 [Boeremia exigua]|uniref:cytochrome P450 n=1 Tax=Boeremia exigua TaxID=749465 RepID=UPI001E8DB7C7|nr:cytochrome P450 [Boeremia exigua]KAH6616873.1 cytochrome P450 [Boeremia exigua]